MQSLYQTIENESDLISYDDFEIVREDVNDFKALNNLSELINIPENRLQFELPKHMKHNVLLLNQREFSIIDLKSKYNVIGTFNVGPNIVLTGHNKDNKVTFMIHFDINTNLNLKTLSDKIPIGEYDCYLIGGLTGYSEKLILNIYNLIKLLPNNYKFNIIGKCLLGSMHDHKSIYMNAIDGNIYTDSVPKFNPSFWNRVNKFICQEIHLKTNLKFI